MDPSALYPTMAPSPAAPIPAPAPAPASSPAPNPGNDFEALAQAMFPSMAIQRTAPVAAAAPPVAPAAPAPPAGQQQSQAAPAAIPEAYQFTPPEGLTLDEGAVAEFTPIARELGLNQAQAQKLVDLYGARFMGATPEAQIQKWEADLMADPEAGSSSAIAAAKSVVQNFGTPELRDALNKSGLGSHPELVRLLARVGRALQSGRR